MICFNFLHPVNEEVFHTTRDSLTGNVEHEMYGNLFRNLDVCATSLWKFDVHSASHHFAIYP